MECVCERTPEGMNAGSAHSSVLEFVSGGSGGGVLAAVGGCCSAGSGSSWETGWGCGGGRALRLLNRFRCFRRNCAKRASRSCCGEGGSGCCRGWGLGCCGGVGSVCN